MSTYVMPLAGAVHWNHTSRRTAVVPMKKQIAVFCPCAPVVAVTLSTKKLPVPAMISGVEQSSEPPARRSCVPLWGVDVIGAVGPEPFTCGSTFFWPPFTGGCPFWGATAGDVFVADCAWTLATSRPNARANAETFIGDSGEETWTGARDRARRAGSDGRRDHVGTARNARRARVETAAASWKE